MGQLTVISMPRSDACLHSSFWVQLGVARISGPSRRLPGSPKETWPVAHMTDCLSISAPYSLADVVVFFTCKKSIQLLLLGWRMSLFYWGSTCIVMKICETLVMPLPHVVII